MGRWGERCVYKKKKSSFKNRPFHPLQLKLLQPKTDLSWQEPTRQAKNQTHQIVKKFVHEWTVVKLFWVCKVLSWTDHYITVEIITTEQTREGGAKFFQKQTIPLQLKLLQLKRAKAPGWPSLYIQLKLLQPNRPCLWHAKFFQEGTIPGMMVVPTSLFLSQNSSMQQGPLSVIRFRTSRLLGSNYNRTGPVVPCLHGSWWPPQQYY
jgi:hypothetical protein